LAIERSKKLVIEISQKPFFVGAEIDEVQIFKDSFNKRAVVKKSNAQRT
jgi:hypothetical protein